MTYDLVEIAWKSVITGGLALLLLTLLQNRSASERSWVAHAGLLATLLLPLATMAIPAWQVEAPAELPSAMVRAHAAPEAAPAAAAQALAVPVSATPGPPSAALSLETLALLLYAIPAALLLLVTVVAVIRLFALRGRASVLVEQNWLSALAHAQRRMGFKHGTALLVSNELASPVSWGILRPIILLNEEAVHSAGEAEAIIAHELAHVARLDWAKLLIARAATSLFWFNPLVWMLAKQCHQLREEAADDAVLRSDVVNTDYAALLVGAARHESKGLLLAANGVAPGRGSLKRRVARVLNPKLSRGPARIAWASACSVGAILVSAPLSALTPVNPLPPSVSHFVATQAPALGPTSAAWPSAPATSAGPAEVANSLPTPPIAAPLAEADPVPAAAAALPTAPASTNLAAKAEAVVLASLASASASAAATVHPHPAPQPVPRPFYADGRLSPDMLIKMKIHGVTPDYISSLAAADPGLANLSPDDLVKMRIHGVTGTKVKQFADLGYRNLSRKQLMNMSIHGVTPDYVRDMARVGYPGLTADQLVKMRIHGVTPAYVRQFRAGGYDNLTADEIIKMRIHGVSLSAGDDP